MNIHPVANIFPSMNDADFQALKDDIAEHGVREPIWTWHDYVIDGRHRLRAATELQIECPMRPYYGDESSLVSFVVSLNLKRRHLNEAQRSMVGAAIATLERGSNQHTAIAAPSQATVSEMLNVSVDSIQRARKVREEGAPELVSAVEQGRVSVSAAADVSFLTHEEQREIVAEGPAAVVEAAKEIRHFRANFSGENEWYTPGQYVEAAREFMGGIDLDPASNERAQETVQATRYFTKEDDGLQQEWHGRVWLNPPYSQPEISQFAEKIVREWQAGRIEEAVMLTHNFTDTGWFHHVAGWCSALCFTRGRIKFIRHDGFSASPTNGQTFFYFGGRRDKFVEHFSNIGIGLIR